MKSEAGDEYSRPSSPAIYQMEGKVRGLPCLTIKKARHQRPYSIERVGMLQQGKKGCGIFGKRTTAGASF